MKRLAFFLFFFNLSFLNQAQEWIRYFGYGQQPYAAYCIENYDKGFILSGSVNNYKYGWVIKTDINGNELWDIKIGDGIHDMMPSNIEQTSDHGFILSGTTNIYNYPNTDPIILKLNSCGELEWCKVLVYDNTSDGGIMVKQTADGGYVFLAEFLGNNPDNRVRLFKFDSGGELFWYKIYNRDSLTFSENLRTIIVDNTNFLITGDCYYPNWLKPYYIQTDTSGNEIWRLVYSQYTGLGYVGDAWATTRDRYGNYYSAGRKDNSPELIKFSSQGDEMMNVDLFPTSSSGGATTILKYSDTNYILTVGWTLNSTTSLGIIKIDTLGSIRKSSIFPNPNNTIITSTSKTFDNKIIVIGTDVIGVNSRIELFKFNSDLECDSIYIRHFTYDSLCPDTIHSHTINPSCDVLVGLKEPIDKTEISVLKVFPNPANRQFTVEFPKYIVIKTGQQGFGSTTIYHKWKSTTLEVFNLSGKKVMEKEIIRSQTSLNLDVSGWQRGMYYFRLMYNNQTVAGEKVVVE